MGYSYPISNILLIFTALCIPSTVLGQEMSPFQATELPYDEFMQNMDGLKALNQDQMQNMSNIAIELIDRTNDTLVRTNQVLNMIFASVVEKIAALYKPPEASWKKCAVSQALAVAFKQTVEACNQAFISEINQLVNTFSNIKSRLISGYGPGSKSGAGAETGETGMEALQAPRVVATESLVNESRSRWNTFEGAVSPFGKLLTEMNSSSSFPADVIGDRGIDAGMEALQAPSLDSRENLCCIPEGAVPADVIRGGGIDEGMEALQAPSLDTTESLVNELISRWNIFQGVSPFGQLPTEIKSFSSFPADVIRGGGIDAGNFGFRRAYMDAIEQARNG